MRAAQWAGWLGVIAIFFSLARPAGRQLAAPAEPKILTFQPWELVTAVAWSPEGRWLAVAAGDQVRLFNSQDWRPLAAYPVGALTHSLAFSPDGRRLAAGSHDGDVRLWELSAGYPISPSLVIDAHKKGVNVVAFSPDGQRLASGGNDAIARVWELPAGRLVNEVIGGTYAVPSVAFTPDGQSLAVINGEFARLREVSTGRIIGSFRSEVGLFAVAINPQGNLLAAGDDENGVLLWDPAQAFKTGQESYPDPMRLEAHAGPAGSFRALIWRVAFSPDGARLASAGGDGQVCLWDVAGRRLVATLSGHTAAATSLAFNPDGRYLASGSLDATVRIWELPK